MYIKYYVEFLLYIFILVVGVGQVTPYLISQPDWSLSGLGVLMLFLVPVLLVHVYRRVRFIVNHHEHYEKKGYDHERD